MELLSARPLPEGAGEKVTVRPRNGEGAPLRPGRHEAAADWLEGLGYLTTGSMPARWRSTVLPRATVPAASGRSSTAGGAADCWDGAWRGCPARRRPSTPFAEEAAGAELSDPKVRRRAADALIRRGYRWEDISAGLRRYGAEPEE